MKTIASFGDPIAANLAKARLGDAGIDAFLANEASVGMAWHLTNAIGGIRLQVADEAADEASAILADKPEAIQSTDQLEGEQPGSDDVIEPDSEIIADDAEEVPINLREQTADRALRGAMFAIFLFPLELYVFYLLIRVFNSELPLGPRHRRNAIIAAVINLPCVVLIMLFVKGWVVG
jgi:hypothetical protein